MPTIPTWSIRNLAVSRGEQIEDTTGGAASTTETVIGTLTPFFASIADRVRLHVAVIARVEVTATTKGSSGGVAIEFRLRADSVSGAILCTKSIGMRYTSTGLSVTTSVVLLGLDAPGIAATTRTYVVTAKKVVGTNITASADWDELTAQATVLSA